MSRADNSDRQFLTLKPEDVGTAVDGKPEKFPFKKLNDILLKLQGRVFAVEGRTQPTVLRNHLSLLAPPVDPSMPGASSSQATLFFSDALKVLVGAEPGASSFSDVFNRVGMWTASADTGVPGTVVWDAEVVSSSIFGFSATIANTSIMVSEPGTYLILTKLSINTVNGGASTATLTTTGNAFSQNAALFFAAATDTYSPVSHLYVWEKTNDVQDGVQVTFTSGDPGALINNSIVPGALVIVKLR